jgi:hypothetical protein
MVMPFEPDGKEPAFVLQDDDRFYRIISSGEIHFGAEPGTISVVTFFVIYRSTGLFDIFVIHKVFLQSGEVRRTVQTKLGLLKEQIDTECASIRDVFGMRLKLQPNFTINWRELDLSKVLERNEQLRRIKVWGGLGVREG